MKKLPLQAILLACLFLLASGHSAFAQTDLVHYSKVFKREKPYRIFLPASYQQEPNRRYPVLYYMHGNKGTHQTPFDNIQELSDKHQLIIVCWNGRSEDSDVRPYNVGYHSNINYNYQFTDYFLEFYQHIDSSFRTQANRKSRAVFGHSMGGFVAYVLGQKFPHLIGLIVNSKGSPEFFMGLPGNHTLIQHRHMLGNMHGLLVRFQHSTIGEELFHLNNEVHYAASQEAGLQYNFQAYDHIHFLNYAQFKDAVDWAAANFKNIPNAPERWHHSSIDASFHIWGYDVSSNLKEPGFIELKGVSKAGFRVQTRKWLPDGIAIPGVKITTLTAPFYEPNVSYNISDFNPRTGETKTLPVLADSKGRLQIQTDHEAHIIGITRAKEKADLTITQFAGINRSRFVHHKQNAFIRIRAWNRGHTKADGVKLRISTAADSVVIDNPEITIGTIAAGQNEWLRDSFRIRINSAPPTDGVSPYIRFNLAFTDNKGNSWKDELDVLPLYDVQEFDAIGVDDGDSEIFGSGNGNNIAEPGELIMIYQESHRTRLYYDDPYIITERLHDDLQPDKWGDGYALSSLIRISPDCPPGHVIKFLASYEVKQWSTINRKVSWGTFSITIGNKKPTTPPSDSEKDL